MVNEARALSYMGKESVLVAPKCEHTISICKSKLFKGSKESYSIRVEVVKMVVVVT